MINEIIIIEIILILMWVFLQVSEMIRMFIINLWILKWIKDVKIKMIILDITIVIKILRVFKIYRLNEMII